MIYSLDTNVCVQYIRGSSAKVIRRLRLIPTAEVIVCDVVRGEMFYGSAKSQTPIQSRAKQLQFLYPYATKPFDTDAALVYGDLRALLERAGKPISHQDVQIAAIALVHNLILVTHNVDEFSRVPGLKIQDWEV
ncbi:MAG: PIN domain-containing protein [Chloroflexota bacterium]|nr:PIN domain-containing protein [Chloroflexota bacterium]